MVKTIGKSGTWRYVAEAIPRDTSDHEMWLAQRPDWQRAALFLLVTSIYFIAGRGGLLLARQNISVSLVWPATGIAIATLLLLGLRLWPAIALGAFLVNVTTTGAIFSSLGIAAGNALEAWAAAWMVRRWANGWRAFERGRDFLLFAFLSGVLATAASATLGVTSLCLERLAKWADYVPLWFHWWVGDGVGALVVTPLIVLLATQPRPRWNPRRWIEAGLLFGGVVLLGSVVFGGFLSPTTAGYPLTFVCIPFLFWTAFRFGPREASVTVFIIAALAIAGTIEGRGRFSVLPPDESLMVALAFLGVVALTTLATAAGVSENTRLDELASQLAAIVDSSYDAIIGKTISGTIVSWNHGAERLYGYSAAEAIGQHVSILSPSEATDETAQLLQMVERQEDIEPFETVRQRKDGSLVDISWRISPVHDVYGKIVGASSISRDISGQKRIEAELVEANDKLKTWLNRLGQESHEITLVNEMSHLLQTALTEEEIGAVIHQFADRLFPGDSGAVCVRTPSLETVETICTWGSYAPMVEQVFNRSDCWALRHGQLHAINDAQRDLLCPHWTHGPRPANALCVPMTAQGDSLGVLLLRRPAAFPAEPGATRTIISREQLAVTVASHIAQALASLRLREKLHIQSTRDPLTGLYNRRYLGEVLEREVRRAARGQRRLALVILDVDGFKALNDSFGHEAGDAFLRELGAFLQRGVREEDIACRYGGDEFVILFTETSLDAARRRARQLQEGIRALSVPHRGRLLAPSTVSLGVALYPDHGASAEELLRAADKALYKAKTRGRDCVVMSGANEASQRAS